MESENNKINYVILIQAFAILTVFIGHATRVFSECGWNYHYAQFDPFCHYLCYFIYSFHMPLLIFLSGFLFYVTKKDDFSLFKYIKKRFKRLIVPFFIVGFLYYVPFLKFVHYQNRSILEILEDFIMLNKVGHLWFLMALFLITCALVPILRFKLNKLTQVSIFAVLTFLTFLKIKGIPSCIVSSIKFAVYFYLGYLFGIYNSVFKNLMCKKYFFVTLIPIWLLSSIAILRDYKNVYLFFISAILSIVLVFSLGIYLSEKFKDLHNNKVVYFLAANMFVLYILHEPIMVVLLKYFNWGVGYNGPMLATCLFILTFAVVLPLVFINNFIKNKIKKI